MSVIDLIALEIPLFTGEGPEFYGQAYSYNRMWAKEGPYQTFLTPFEEGVFTTWIDAYNVPFDPNASIVDYDMRGYWKNIALPGVLGYTQGDHFPDTYKTPFDTSFSAESMYAKSGCPFHWHGDKLYNEQTGQLIFWAAYVPPPQQTAVEIMEHSSIDPDAIGKGFMGDIDMQNFVLYLIGKIRLRAFDQVTDARVILTIEGSSTVEVDLNDDDRSILRSGTLSSALDFKLDGLWWELVAVKKDQGDTLTLVFEDRTIAKLRLKDKFIMAKRSQVTRAQFILRMIRELGFNVRVVIPELKMIQPLEKSNTGGQFSDPTAGSAGIPATPTDDAPDSAKPGTKAYAERNLTVKGNKANKDQIGIANIILDQGIKMGVSRKILVCSIMTAIVENRITNTPDGDADSVGVFQQRASWGTFDDRYDPRTAAAMFFKAAIKEDREHPQASYNDLCQLVQKSGTPYEYGKRQAEAENFVTAYGIPGTVSTPIADLATIAPIPGGSSEASLSNDQRASSIPSYSQTDWAYYRGTPSANNKSWELEDSWTCIQRLADEVHWRAFFRLGVFWYTSEEFLFTNLQPIMNITESSDGVDYISFDYDRGKRYAQVTLSARVHRWQAPPGSIIVLHDVGPINGKWLVSEFQRSLFDTTAEITLKKPLPALGEPTGTQSIPSTGQQTPATGTDSVVVTAADKTYKCPFRDTRNLYAGRIDNGVDYSADNMSPIYAIGPAKITYYGPHDSWGAESAPLFGARIAYTLTDGPAAGKTVFVAEYIKLNSEIKLNDVVDSSTIIATFDTSGAPGLFTGDGIETGWAMGPGNPNPLANAYGGWTDLGENFSQFLESLGCSGGRYERGHVGGPLPVGWPKWSIPGA